MPVYNEGGNIGPVLEGIAAAVSGIDLELLIVYDFDEDDTVPVVRALQPRLRWVRLCRNELGRGVLRAIRAGFGAAQAPYVLVMMADGSDEPEAIPRMLALAQAGADVVAGSRYMRGGSQVGGPRLKRTLSRIAGLSLYWMRRLPIHDATSNFRLYSRRLLSQVTIESSAGFELALELTVKARRLGLRVEEVPTVWHDRTAGQSRFRMWEWIPHYLKWYWKGLLPHPQPPPPGEGV
jgi:glycosyltransferase involved in cell wall biosynthesis